LDALADLCEVTPRTVKRDLRLLREEFGAPLCYSRERQGYCYEREFSLVPSPFHERELLALSIAIEVANTFRNTPFPDAVHNALEKLQTMMPQTDRAAYEDVSAAVTYVPEAAPPERLETVIHFNDLLDAINSHRQVQMTYHSMSADAEAVRVVDPYQLYLYRGMWYLHGLCHLRHEYRDFAINRIRDLRVLTSTFDPPDPEQLRARLSQRFTIFQDAPATVSIWFDTATARRIK
jgi:predicted DNA-binding transcriptional regulator YafY